MPRGRPRKDKASREIVDIEGQILSLIRELKAAYQQKLLNIRGELIRAVNELRKTKENGKGERTTL